MSNIEERVKKVIASRLNKDPSEIKNDAKFIDDLGADSLDLVELVMDLETEFDVTIEDEQSEKITSVQSAIDEIEAKLAE